MNVTGGTTRRGLCASRHCQEEKEGECHRECYVCRPEPAADLPVLCAVHGALPAICPCACVVPPCGTVALLTHPPGRTLLRSRAVAYRSRYGEVDLQHVEVRGIDKIVVFRAPTLPAPCYLGM